jgi:GxxExxY protein
MHTEHADSDRMNDLSGRVIGCEDLLPIELKTAKALDDAHPMQGINDLKATGLRLCLLLNFGRPRLEIKRVAHSQ